MTTLNELRKKAVVLEPVARLGKNGLNAGQVEQIAILLKKYKLIKIRVLKSFPELGNLKDIAGRLAEDTGSELVQVVGHMIILHKK